jgi:hypothetical protein
MKCLFGNDDNILFIMIVQLWYGGLMDYVDNDFFTLADSDYPGRQTNSI